MPLNHDCDRGGRDQSYLIEDTWMITAVGGSCGNSLPDIGAFYIHSYFAPSTASWYAGACLHMIVTIQQKYQEMGTQD